MNTLIAFCLIGGMAYADGTTCDNNEVVLPACIGEDSLNCYWHSPSQGNGVSFADIGGTLFFWDGHIAE